MLAETRLKYAARTGPAKLADQFQGEIIWTRTKYYVDVHNLNQVFLLMWYFHAKGRRLTESMESIMWPQIPDYSGIDRPDHLNDQQSCSSDGRTWNRNP
jgi:hypothetical protein